MSHNYSYFAHKECEYFPCHKGADPENFNCLFCYCPLYALGRNCGGAFQYKENGVKDCTNCLFRTDAKTTKRLSRATRTFWAY